MLKEALVGSDEMNLTRFAGKDISIPAVIDAAETMPFFAERRLILIEDSGLLKSGGEELADYLKELPETAYFVMTEAQSDKRSRLFKVCQTNGVAVEFARQDEKTLKTWVASVLQRDGKKMTERDIEHFLTLTGDDMVNIRGEIEKLVCYTGDREIVTAADADRITTRQIGNHIFDMIEAIGSRQQEKALSLYYELLSLKEAPLSILFLVVRQFNLLLQTKELMEKRQSKYEIGEKIKLPHFIAEKYMRQTRHFTGEQLREALRFCADTEEDIKSGRIGDRMGIELVIVGLSG